MATTSRTVSIKPADLLAIGFPQVAIVVRSIHTLTFKPAIALRADDIGPTQVLQVRFQHPAVARDGNLSRLAEVAGSPAGDGEPIAELASWKPPARLGPTKGQPGTRPSNRPFVDNIKIVSRARPLVLNFFVRAGWLVCGEGVTLQGLGRL